jgi:hypothetical protein
MTLTNPKEQDQAATLRELFGELVVYLAARTDPVELNLTADLVDQVHDAADTMLALRDNRAALTGYIAAMPFTLRLVLCMWTMDVGLATKIIRSTIA